MEEADLHRCVTQTNKQINFKIMNVSCPICFDILEENNRAKPDICEHIFCILCLQTWSKHGSFCPIDRKKFRKIINLHSETAVKVKPRKRKFARAFYDVTAYCEVCKNSSNCNTLLLCDSCDLGYHCDCLTPPLKVIPRSRWYCPECVAVELRLRTNKATPADSKYVKNVRKKRRKYVKKSSKEKNSSKRKYIRKIYCSSSRQSCRETVSSTRSKIRHCLKADNISEENNITNVQNIDQPGPSTATNPASNDHFSLDNFDLDPEDIVFSSSDESAVKNKNKASSSSESDFFERDFFDFDDRKFNSSSDDDTKEDIDNGFQHKKPHNARDSNDSFEYGDSDFNISFSDDNETEEENKPIISSSEQLTNSMPPADENLYYSSEDDFFLRNFDFNVSFSGESEKEDEGGASGNQPEQLQRTNEAESQESSSETQMENLNLTKEMSAASPPQDSWENSPSFLITNSDFDTSSSEACDSLKNTTENVHCENNFSDKDGLNQNAVEDETEQNLNASPQNEETFIGDFEDSSGKNPENKTANVHIFDFASSEACDSLKSTTENVHCETNFSDKDGLNQNAVEDETEQNLNASLQNKETFTGDFDDSSLKNPENKTKNVHTSKENVGLNQKKHGESMDDLNILSSEDRVSDTDSLNHNAMEDKTDQRLDASRQSNSKFTRDFNYLSVKNPENKTTNVYTAKENVGLNQEKQVESTNDLNTLSSEDSNSMQYVVQNFENKTTNVHTSEENVGLNQEKQGESLSDLDTLSSEDSNSMQYVVQNLENKTKNVHTCEENVGLNQEKQCESMNDLDNLSSEDSNSVDTFRDDLYEKERDISEETSSSSLDCGLSAYPEAIVLKLPLQLSVKRSTMISNKKDSSSHSSPDSVVKNMCDISAQFCKIAAVTSCPISLFKNLESESTVPSNENEHLNEDINKTNQSSEDTSAVRKDDQVAKISITANHASDHIPIIFSLIENKSSKLSQTEKVYCYNSFVSVKDSNPSSGQTFFESINKIGEDSSDKYFKHKNNVRSLTVADKTSPSETLVQKEFKLQADESGKVIVPPDLSHLFKSSGFLKDIRHLSAKKDGALFLNWRKPNS